MISMWNKEKDTIMSSNPLENKYDHVIFVSNKFEPPHSPEELKFWFGDYQICFSGSVNGKCISKDDRIFYISLWRMEPSSEYIGKYNNKNLYIDYISQ